MDFLLATASWIFDVVAWKWWGKDETARIYREEKARGRKLNMYEQIDEQINTVPPAPFL